MKDIFTPSQSREDGRDEHGYTAEQAESPLAKDENGNAQSQDRDVDWQAVQNRKDEYSNEYGDYE